jgi:hypothetical protein
MPNRRTGGATANGFASCILTITEAWAMHNMRYFVPPDMRPQAATNGIGIPLEPNAAANDGGRRSTSTFGHHRRQSGRSYVALGQ